MSDLDALEQAAKVNFTLLLANYRRAFVEHVECLFRARRLTMFISDGRITGGLAADDEACRVLERILDAQAADQHPEV